ncbi:hypothetical protein AB0K64_29080 [Streptomyces sp. NPDC053741]|uniref:hypothetical protein n=1 Tax=Streptomyces TaxID=1883 RepID=UPI0003138F43|nr:MULTISPECIES: hypothetical protein [Streptomyces]WSZ52288.1 hypothetical protein OG337_35165 [[Kitasatospora] papulosa]MCY1655524.1 hypothetical protein [Streptomyces sp. SL203]MCY1677126.1 hypothetical protein [Streptomyces sp. SL294]MDF6066793.1 hypothetical protein [Streptomyces sp. JH010]MDX3186739.1 hypothetical protein [Streptomyces sp. ME02-7008A-1]
MADHGGKHAEYGPPEPPPEEWAADGDVAGIDTQGHWCVLDFGATDGDCGPAEAGDLPGTIGVCESADGNAARNCSETDRRQYENLRLDKWRKAYDQDQGNFDELNGYVTACVERGGLFQQCLQGGQNTYPPDAKSPVSWAAGKISELASDALQEAARYIGKAVVWLLEEYAKIFNSSSTIDLSRTGIDSATGVMTTLSLVIATFLLLLQFGKVAVSQRGEPAATAVIGLAKWGVVSSVYVLATQTALSWSDAVSTWIINYTFEGGGSGEADATEAMQHQLGTLFGGLITGGGGAATVGTALVTGEGVAAAAVGVIIVVGIVCILAIAALWLEVLLRQAGIMILVATMPVVLAGQLSDSTQEWWPKARNALIALILMKPMIVLCFAIGFGAMAEGQGVQNMFVGLVIFILACFAWPVLAKFMTFSTVGGGSAIASGLMSSVGSSAASAGGGYRPEMGGAGAVGGGSAYTRALEQDTAQTAASGSHAAPVPGSGAGGSAAGGAGRSFGSKVFGTVALPLQLLAAGKDTLESGMASTAGHAGLDHGAAGGRHVVIAQRSAAAASAHPPGARPEGAAAQSPAPVQPPPPALPPRDDP